MTSNQIAYRQAVETERHNRAMEDIQVLGTMVSLGEALTHREVGEAQAFSYYSSGYANLYNAITNRYNAKTNELNAFVNMYEASTSRMNAHTNEYNAVSNRMNAITNQGNLLVNAANAQTQRYGTSIALLNAFANLSNAQTRTTEVQNAYTLEESRQILDYIEFEEDLSFKKEKQKQDASIAMWEATIGGITGIIRGLGDVVRSTTSLINFGG